MHPVIMLLFNIILGGCLLIAGAFVLSSSIETAFKAKMSSAVVGIRDGYLSAFFMSIGITALVQSSSAITVITLSLVNAGALSLVSAMAVVYGANIGTTVTAQMMSLDISGAWMHIIALGAALYCLSFLFRRLKLFAAVIFATGLIFAGIKTLGLSVSIMKETAYILSFIEYYGSNKFYCVLFGFITTALIHSSSATVGLTVQLFSGGVIGFTQAIAIILGDNIGTCMTAQIAAIPANESGRRVAWGHTFYNVLGSIAVFLFIEQFEALVIWFTRVLGQSDSFLVANSHSLFNVLGALVFLPLNKPFCGFLEAIIKDDKPKKH